MSDTPGDKPFLLKSNMKSFMKYDVESNSIIMSEITKERVGTYAVSLTLADNFNATKTYIFSIEIKDLHISSQEKHLPEASIWKPPTIN